MWTDFTALQQYYPLAGTSFWIDYHLWGYDTFPYHVENVLLHALAALLFCALLRRLQVPGPWLAAAIFALHPMMTESAAWITERKNVLSLTLFLGALLAYGRFAQFWQTDANPATDAPGPLSRPWSAYSLAWLLFLAALLAKATAFCLPPTLLLLCWWKRGRFRWRGDVLPTLPFFALAVGLGLVTAWLEKNHVGARGPDFDISFPQRCIIAGHALWFYAGKLIWPANLCFVYPRWQPDAASLSQWAWPITAAAVVLTLWLARRRIGRGPLTAILFFIGALFPLLGFMNGYFMRYSFVCDHWAYFSSLGFIALVAALIARITLILHVPRALDIFAAVFLPVLALLTWRQSAMYLDSKTLFQTTLERNPNANLDHDNLGLILFQEGHTDEAIAHFRRAVEIRPTSANAHNNLANALRQTGDVRGALQHYQKSLDLDPANPGTYGNLAWLLAACSDASIRNGPKAVTLAEKADQLSSGANPVIAGTLAAAYAESGRFPQAIATVQRALSLVSAHPNSQLYQMLNAQLTLYRAGTAFHEPQP